MNSECQPINVHFFQAELIWNHTIDNDTTLLMWTIFNKGFSWFYTVGKCIEKYLKKNVEIKEAWIGNVNQWMFILFQAELIWNKSCIARYYKKKCRNLGSLTLYKSRF